MQSPSSIGSSLLHRVNLWFVREKFRFVDAEDVKKYFVFITGGGIGALVNWLISFMLTSLFGIYYLVSYLIAQFFNIIVNFTWHRYITFCVKSSSREQFFKFILLSSATALLSLGLVFIIKEFVMDSIYEVVVWGFKLNYLTAIVLVTFMVSIINYVVSKIWIFKNIPNNQR